MEGLLDRNSCYLSSPFKPGALGLPGPVLLRPLGLPDGGPTAVGLFPQVVIQGTEKGRYSLGCPRSLGQSPARIYPRALFVPYETRLCSAEGKCCVIKDHFSWALKCFACRQSHRPYFVLF